MKKITLLFSFFVSLLPTRAQRFQLFSEEVKADYPSVVYDFLERYLYEIDSLQNHHTAVDQKLHNDKVIFLTGNASTARQISGDAIFRLNKVDGKYYQVNWSDTLGNTILDLAFPMQYELLLGKPKVEIEKEFKATLQTYTNYVSMACNAEDMKPQDDGCFMSHPVSNYYVESLNTATYYKDHEAPTFSNTDKWHSAANLFQGCVDDIGDYTLYVEQNLYGFQTICYSVPLIQWLAYCQSMKLITYFAIEEEKGDGMKALLIAQSQDLGFNHMMSIIIPDNFVENRKSVLKATLNAYIPTQNIKNLYQQYVDKPKKRI